jgi:hypothetical protein
MGGNDRLAFLKQEKYRKSTDGRISNAIIAFIAPIVSSVNFYLVVSEI